MPLRRLIAQMQQFRVMGAPDALGYKPELVASQAVSETEKLLDIMVETNPADKECDSRIRVTSRSLQAVYNAVSIRALGFAVAGTCDAFDECIIMSLLDSVLVVSGDYRHVMIYVVVVPVYDCIVRVTTTMRPLLLLKVYRCLCLCL